MGVKWARNYVSRHYELYNDIMILIFFKYIYLYRSEWVEAVALIGLWIPFEWKWAENLKQLLRI